MLLVDVNVLLDVLARREPHFRQSAAVVDQVVRGGIPGAVAASTVTTLHFLVKREKGPHTAGEAVDWVLRHFSIAPTGEAENVRARSIGMADFEDAVVAATAESYGCTAIVTRNVKDFAYSPVRAVLPSELRIDQVHESFVRDFRGR